MGLLEGAQFAQSVMGQGQDTFDRFKKLRQERGLASLMANYANGGQPDFQGIEANGGNSITVRNDMQAQNDRGAGEAARYAQMFLALPPKQKQQAYPGLVAQVNSLKMDHPPIPNEYDPQFDAGIAQFAQALGGAKDQQGSGVQSSFVDNQGRRMAIMRDGSVRELGQNAESFRPIEGAGGIYGFNPRNNTSAPTMVGGQAPQAQPPPRVQFDFAPGTSPEVMGAMRSYAGVAQPGAVEEQPSQQLQPAAKPVADKGSYSQLSPAEVQGLGLPAGTVAQRGPDGKVDVISKPDVKAPAQSQATMRRNQSAADTARATLDTIAHLTQSPGYKSLGTIGGDIATHTPFIRTDAKDAQQQLDVLGGQIALSTMASLKALSAQGATGFGALNREELKLLQNSVSSLQAGNLSHAQLDKNISVIEEKMAKIERASIDALDGAPAAPSGGNRPSVTTQAQFDALPSGAEYLSTDGVPHRKP